MSRYFVTKEAHGITRYRTSGTTWVVDRLRAEPMAKAEARRIASELTARDNDLRSWQSSWQKYGIAKV